MRVIWENSEAAIPYDGNISEDYSWITNPTFEAQQELLKKKIMGNNVGETL